MNQHSKSLLVSIVVHSLLLATVFYVYTTASTYIGKAKEKRVCIKLGTIQQVATTTGKLKKQEVKKSVEKKPKPVKKNPPKSPKKKPIKKKVPKQEKPKEIKKVKKVPKKELPKKVIPPKPLPEPTVVEEVIPKIEEDLGNEEVCAKTVKENEVNEACANESQAEKTTQVESAEDEYVNLHLQEIARLLQENLYYPRRARKRGIEGKVTVRFTLKENAEVIDIVIISSNEEILSRGAIKTLENLSGEFPKPDERLVLTVPISYQLSH